MVLLTLVAATLVSEDLACVAAGVLIAEGRLDFTAGVAACAAGILIGDVGLWAAGASGRRLARPWPSVARRLGRMPVDAMREWLDRNAAGALLSSRFLPGTRLPLYLCAGYLGLPFRTFATWTTIAVLLWTPLAVSLAAGTDGALAAGAADDRINWMARIATAIAVLTLLKLAQRAATRTVVAVAPPGPSGTGAVPPGSGAGAAAPAPAYAASRAPAKGTKTLARWSRWEFWPTWLFYAPVAAWIVILSIRYRGVSTITASNPGIADGGVVGESKFDILSQLPEAWTIPSARVDLPAHARAAAILELMAARRWPFPVVLKPDVGQRGVGVRLARNAGDVAAYCAEQVEAILVQPYHPGPFEAGVFYYRFPHEERGRILSITDKQFPELIGDGRSTVAQLIEAHPRYRLQSRVFLSRHRDAVSRVLAPGERLPLAIAGNHAQGTLFRDGAHLRTPALEARIDDIARAFPGFYIGRFDLRYADAAAFTQGLDLAIVELNGATAESTNIYDPERSLIQAYRQLFTQWSLVFAIGVANRAAGAPVTPMRELLRAVRRHVTSAPAMAISD